MDIKRSDKKSEILVVTSSRDLRSEQVYRFHVSGEEKTYSIKSRLKDQSIEKVLQIENLEKKGLISRIKHHFEPKLVRRHSSSSLKRSNSSLYVEQKTLGKGANAIVSLATSNRKTYAIKKFRKKRPSETEREYLKKLSAEFCIASSLHHPNVIETIDLIQDEDDNWCQVMEYMDLGDLFQFIIKKPILKSISLCLFKQLLSGVDYLHKMGVAHCDLKPENLLLGYGNILKIGDFGSSKVFRIPWTTDKSAASGLCGSDPYIAPEEWEPKNYEPEKVDVWACGIILHVLITNKLPWKNATIQDKNYALYLRKNTIEIDEDLNVLLKKILNPDPLSRPSTTDVLGEKIIIDIPMCKLNNFVHEH